MKQLNLARHNVAVQIARSDGRRRAVSPASVAAAFVLLVGCAVDPSEAPRLEAREDYLIGEAPDVRGDQLRPGAAYTVEAERTDRFGRRWVSTAVFEADELGRIALNRRPPTQGSYAGADPFGLLWSMRMPDPPGDEWRAPPPKDVETVAFSLTEDGQVLASVTTRQWIVPPSARSEAAGGDVVADVFLPANLDAPAPAILLLGGSGGGNGWASRTGAQFAERGYVAMALSYFRSDGLPEHLAQIPLEYVDGALDQFIARPDVDAKRLGVMGYSKGAELALLLASRRPDVAAVVAVAPGSAVFQGFKPPKYPVVSSWTLAGKDVPFVPNAYDDKFFETYDGMYLWYRTLDQHDAMTAAAIPVENIQGDILLLSGVEDRIWPSTLMAEQIIGRLHVAEFAHAATHLAYPNAGHGIAEPPGTPTTTVAEQLGGTAAGNAAARRDGWAAITDFFDARFKGS